MMMITIDFAFLNKTMLIDHSQDTLRVPSPRDVCWVKRRRPDGCVFGKGFQWANRLTSHCCWVDLSYLMVDRAGRVIDVAAVEFPVPLFFASSPCHSTCQLVGILFSNETSRNTRTDPTSSEIPKRYLFCKKIHSISGWKWLMVRLVRACGEGAKGPTVTWVALLIISIRISDFISRFVLKFKSGKMYFRISFPTEGCYMVEVTRNHGQADPKPIKMR